MYFKKSKSKSPSYLFRNPHSDCFRMGVPIDLRDVVGKREFRYSLRTGRLSEARRKAHLLSGLLWQLYYKLRSNRALYGKTQVESMVSGFFGFVLEGVNELTDAGPINNVSTSEPGPRLKRLVDEYLEENNRSGRWSKRTEKEYPYVESSRRSVQRTKALTIRHRTSVPRVQVIAELNRTLCGWSNYFYYRNSTAVMSKVKMHVGQRVRTHLRRRHKLISRAQAYQRFPGHVIYGRYGLFKLPTTAPWRSAHALV
jgi:hypothetical protein